ncbi:MAG: helix-turn-helix transcriptional regulator [Streptococcaceae bacterium]|jgi:predicted transcriptional regulator|nr:helix-turn-helix transcriptional regulator [Streptococcaceae bacterium]
MKTKSFDALYQDYQKDEETAKLLETEGERLETAVALMQLRESEGLTQRELADIVGKPQSTIARVENGTMNVSFNTLAEIAQAMGKKMKVSFR